MYGSGRAIAASDAEVGDASATAAHDGGSPPSEISKSDISLEMLYREESPRLLRSLARKTGRDEARDLVQEMFCRMARLGAGGGLRLERPQAYLSRMAANLLRDEGRRASRHMTGNHVPVDDSLAAGVDQQRLLESRDMLTRVEAAMLKLRPRTREIFMAHRIDGLSYAEIAERMGITVKGVEKQMSKAIAKIDRLLDRG